MAPPLIMLIPYFGRWPEWIELFVESCKWNPDVRWRFYTDCGEPQNKAGNVDYVHLSFDDYKALARARLGIACEWPDPYKLCDLKPCLGHIHEADIDGYRFFGFGDIDVIYGNIREIYTDELLSQCNVVSTHGERVSGHFAVVRNSKAVRRAYERIPNYRDLLAQPHHVGMDEAYFTNLFLQPAQSQGLAPEDPLRQGLLFVERYSTILSPRGWHDGTMSYPQRWFWRCGRLTNDRDGAREFLYLHFMRWHSARWINNPPAPGEAAWVGRDRIVRVDWRRAAVEGFCISPEGFTPAEIPTS